MELRQSFQQMVLELLDIHTEKNGCRHRPYTLHKSVLKTDHRPTCTMYKYETCRNIEENPHDLGIGNDLLA
jgi:hypothetical protein